MITVSRNDALGFAARTKQNLLMIEKAFEAGEDVHVVTQLVVSLLGLVVYPRVTTSQSSIVAQDF